VFYEHFVERSAIIQYASNNLIKPNALCPESANILVGVQRAVTHEIDLGTVGNFFKLIIQAGALLLKKGSQDQHSTYIVDHKRATLIQRSQDQHFSQESITSIANKTMMGCNFEVVSQYMA
jgi:hypothetical protein